MFSWDHRRYGCAIVKFVVELEGVCKRFGKVVALDNVSLGLRGKFQV